MESYAQALAEEFPQDKQAPWMVVYAMHRQGKNQQAWTYLDGNDLIPPTKEMARVAIAVCRTADGPEHDAERLLQISELYADTEEVAGTALMTLVTRSDLFKLTEDQKARLQTPSRRLFCPIPTEPNIREVLGRDPRRTVRDDDSLPPYPLGADRRKLLTMCSTRSDTASCPTVSSSI